MKYVVLGDNCKKTRTSRCQMKTNDLYDCQVSRSNLGFRINVFNSEIPSKRIPSVISKVDFFFGVCFFLMSWNFLQEEFFRQFHPRGILSEIPPPPPPRPLWGTITDIPKRKSFTEITLSSSFQDFLLKILSKILSIAFI